MKVMAGLLVASSVGIWFGCGGTNGTGPGDECPSGVPCANGCCANAAESCVLDPSTGMEGCLPNCVSRSDCSTGCCAPLTDAAGNITGPYVCQSSNACCYVGVCPGATCCVADGNGNEFCATKCSGPGTCGGASVCEPFNFSHTTCSGSMACGPP